MCDCVFGWPAFPCVCVQVNFGLVNGGGMESLLRIMSSVFVPQISNKTSWPESVKKEFTGQLHRFMASLMETVGVCGSRRCTIASVHRADVVLVGNMTVCAGAPSQGQDGAVYSR